MSGNEAATLLARGGRRDVRPVPSVGPDPRSAPLGVAVVGDDETVELHAGAWRTAGLGLDPGLAPALVVLSGADDDEAADSALRHGWAATAADWRDVVGRPDVDLVHVCSASDTRAEIVLAALEAGHHVLCDAPLAATRDDVLRMAAAAARAEEHAVRAVAGLPLRRLDAVARARRVVREGRIGEVRHVRARFEQDWLLDPQTPLSWRLQEERAGLGALGDLGAHVVDLAAHVTGERLVGVSALVETFVRERPLPGDVRGLRATPGSWSGPVTVDDAAVLLGRLGHGALAVLEVTRVAPGRPARVRLEVDGSAGALVLDTDDTTVLRVRGTAPGPDAWRATGAGRAHPDESAPDLPDGREAVARQAADLVRALAHGGAALPSFAEALAVHEVLDAAARSAARGAAWTPVGPGA